MKNDHTMANTYFYPMKDEERIDAEYAKLEQELMNDEITPDEHVERYNELLELEPQSFGPPELHEHI